MIDLIITIVEFLFRNVFSLLGIGIVGTWAVRKYVLHKSSGSTSGGSSSGSSGSSNSNSGGTGIIGTVNNGIDVIYVLAGAAVIVGFFKFREYMKSG